MPETNIDPDVRIEAASFTADGVYVVRDLDGRPLSWTFNGTLPGLGFGGGTIAVEATNLSAADTGLSGGDWSADTGNGIWEPVLAEDAPILITGSATGWIDAPFRFVRFRLSGSSEPSILGRVLAGVRGL